MKLFLHPIWLFLVTACPVLTAQNLTIHADTPTVELSQYLYGLFFEDINYAADGGLYAELVQNRSFEYYPLGIRMESGSHEIDPMTGWEKVYREGGTGAVHVTHVNRLNAANRSNLEIAVANDDGWVGCASTGYDGIPLQQGERYHLSLFVRRDVHPRTKFAGHQFRVQLEDGTGNVLDSVAFDNIGRNWQQVTAELTSPRDVEDGRLVLLFKGTAIHNVDIVSLFPANTYRNRKNGLRRDLVEALAELQPSFLRFPGGCILHGAGLDNTYRWKDTVGRVEDRKPNWNLWGYHQTYGLGFYEYFLLCEDLGMTPLPVVPVGVGCGFRNFEFVPMDQLQSEIQDALDLVEFATGPADSRWGSVRAAMGHPQPFDLKYLCLGNEEHDTPQVRERIPGFVKAIRARYPELKIIGTSGLGPAIPLSDLSAQEKLWSTDEHYYMSPEWYVENQYRFDGLDRDAPKIFVGEYASRGNTLYNAVAEAVFLTGVERNGDHVDMTCYAPLFARYGNTQWTRANLIHFNNQQVVRTPNFYVQQLFSSNKGDVSLDIQKDNWTGNELAVSATRDNAANEVILKVVNAGRQSHSLSVELRNVERPANPARLTLLTGEPADENTAEYPDRVKPVSMMVDVDSTFELRIPPMSVQVMRIPIRE